MILLGILASSVPGRAGESLPPAEAASYYRDLRRADQLLADSDVAAAAEIYSHLVAVYSEDGGTWARLGHCRYNLGQYEAAIVAYRRSNELGIQFPLNTIYNVACCYGLLGDADHAFEWLQRALDEGWENRTFLGEDSDLESLHDDPRWAGIAGLLPDGDVSRDEGWRYDIEFLGGEIRRLHYDPYRVHGPEEFEAALASLYDRVPDLDDEQIWMEMQKILVMLGDGHSGLRPRPGSRVSLSLLPIQLYLFSDGLFVIGAGNEDLVGAEVLAIGDMDVPLLLESVGALLPRDNDMGILARAPLALTMPAVLRNLGAIDSTTVPLAIRDAAGSTRTVRLEPETVNLENHHERIGLMSSWLETTGDLPLYLAREDENYWFQKLPDSGALFVQFNSVRDEPELSLADFAGRLREVLEGDSVNDVILDIRHNGGGNSFLYPPLVRAMIEFEQANPDASIFVLAGRHTFSAAQNFATDMESWTDAVFAGEPTGSRPNFIGESTSSVLPYSGLRLGVSSRFHQVSYPGDERPWIAPRIPVSLTSADYFAKRDPVLETVLEVIGERQPAAD